METTDSIASPPGSGSDLLNLYIHQHTMAVSNLAVERDITVKNYLALGAVMLLQTGFFTTALKTHVILIACGLVILFISLAARAMTILYGKYSSRLFAGSSIYRKAYLRGKSGLYILDRFDSLRKAGGLPDAENLSWNEFLTKRGTLATINTAPALVGLILIILGLLSWIKPDAATSLLRDESLAKKQTFLSVVAPNLDVRTVQL